MVLGKLEYVLLFYFFNIFFWIYLLKLGITPDEIIRLKIAKLLPTVGDCFGYQT